tara:strand:+ start:32 stop:592 length:561 start_codon:yes stop_codon:yes gene_type:complete
MAEEKKNNKNKIWDYKSNENDKLAEKVEKDNSIVMTKETMAQYLISLVEYEEGDVWLEPCRGDGAFYNNFPDDIQKDWCEINEGRDYFDYDGEVDITISNPPFVPRKLFVEFTNKAMSSTRKNIYWLVNISCLNSLTPRRLDAWKQKNWFVERLHIVQDKRWFGRYVFIKFGRNHNNFYTWKTETF